MSEITAALDEAGANKLLATAVSLIGPRTTSGSGGLGPFTANYTVTATLTSGPVDLIPPSTIRITDLRLDWHVNMTFVVDLNQILPKLCLPQVCIDLGFTTICTPSFCLPWPVIPIPVSFGDFLKTTVDFSPDVTFTGGVWRVQAKVLGVPNLQFGATSAALLVAIGVAATAVLLPIPFIGPFLALGVDAILAFIAVAGVTGFLGPILTPLISGLLIPIYKQPKNFVALAASSAVDPQVDFNIDAITAVIAHNGTEDELVLGAEISA